MLEETRKTFSRLSELTNNNSKNWQELLHFVGSLKLEERRKYVWAWPTQHQLVHLNEVVENLKIVRVLSIGCGNGLLEWLLKESTGALYFGLEVDRSWWQSTYAVNSFFELSYLEDAGDDLGVFLQQCAQTKDWNFALLFCYFNNRKAFLQYLQVYRGHWLIIIGPLPGVGVHTDPCAIEPQFPANSQWLLRQKLNFDNNNVLTIYSDL